MKITFYILGIPINSKPDRRARITVDPQNTNNCHRCGKPISPNFDFCYECNIINKGAAAQTWKCQYCGTRNINNSLTCRNCGAQKEGF